MDDLQDKTAEQLAAELGAPPIEQVAATEYAVEPPANASAANGELILGKFRSQDDLVHAYTELERTFTASRQAVQEPRRDRAEPPASVFDAETEGGIASIVEARLTERLERERAAEFSRKHKADLADPLLRGAVLIEIQEANQRGEYMDQETALANAKRALETRLAPKVEAASKESFDEGRALARKKEQAGAVGATTARAAEVDPDALTAAEYAEYYGLGRA